MKWTPQQNEVINSRGQNILVSAAAGSGKTAVLIERIKTLILSDKVDVDRFLITTFTNAASAEMKNKLEKSLREEIKKPGTDTEFLKRQLNLIPRANIGTFHTFALEMMRQYFYLTDLEPGFVIGDDTRIGIMESEGADELIEERFANDYERFTSFLTKYSGDRNEKKFKETILKFYKEIRSIPNYIEWLKKRAAVYSSPAPLEELNMIPFLMRETYLGLCDGLVYFCRARDVLLEYDLKRMAGIVDGDISALKNKIRMLMHLRENNAKGNIPGIEDIKVCLELDKLAALRANSEEKEAYEDIKDRIKKLRTNGKSAVEDVKKKLFYLNEQEIKEEFVSQGDDVEYLIELTEDLENRIKGKKNAENMVDFDDAMHYAIEILRNSDATREYQDRFEYIFIDEFQDSNLLQELIIGRIARNNNVFMVGDVKQSIYKFRLAEPEIFKRKYKAFSDESRTDSKKIDLNMNFRSKKKVVDTVNLVFRSVMEEYGENEELKCGVGDVNTGLDSQLYLIDGKAPNPASEEEVIADIIRKKLGLTIFDVKENREKAIDYRDIVVLARNKSSVASLERYLNNEGIPAYGETGEGYFSTVEILVLMNILRIIDNMQQDIPLISAMRSVVFDFDVTELAEIRMNSRSGSYISAVKAYEASGCRDELKAKITHMYDKILYWRKLSKTVPLEDLVRTVIYDTGYYDYCSGLPMGKQRTTNLKQLIETAAEFENNSFSGLYGFLSYIDAMNKNSLSVGEAKIINENEKVVRIMTVHKSKGLEFPIVILAAAGKTIRAGGASGSGLVHKDFAPALPVVNTKYLWHRKSYLQNIIARKKSREQYEEEVRILYVALTRAKDNLVIVGTVKNFLDAPFDSARRNSFVDMVYGAFDNKNVKLIQESGITPKNASKDSHMLEELKRRSEEIKDEARVKDIDNLLSFKYKYDYLGKVKSKYSVTELNRRGGPDAPVPPALVKPAFFNREKKLSSAEIGTAMHRVMEKLSFAKAMSQGRSYIDDAIEGLVRNGLLSEEERASVNVDNIARFFQSELGQRAGRAYRLEKEKEFLLQMKVDGADTIVQGVIDCFFEEEDGIVLMDYKNSYLSDRIGEEEIIERYRGQLEIYRKALEEATGKKVKEAYIYLFRFGKFIEVS